MSIVEFVPNPPIKGNQVTCLYLPVNQDDYNYDWIEKKGVILLKVKCEDCIFLLVILNEDINK